jgi:ElaB/YqjD/DUF883 family membrane-anchored ribosome-binding protein
LLERAWDVPALPVTLQEDLMRATYSDARSEVRKAGKEARRAVARRSKAASRSLSRARDEAGEILSDVRDAAETAHDRVQSWPHAALVGAFVLGVIAAGFIGRRA